MIKKNSKLLWTVIRNMDVKSAAGESSKVRSTAEEAYIREYGIIVNRLLREI